MRKAMRLTRTKKVRKENGTLKMKEKRMINLQDKVAVCRTETTRRVTLGIFTAVLANFSNYEVYFVFCHLFQYSPSLSSGHYLFYCFGGLFRFSFYSLSFQLPLKKDLKLLWASY